MKPLTISEITTKGVQERPLRCVSTNLLSCLTGSTQQSLLSNTNPAKDKLTQLHEIALRQNKETSPLLAYLLLVKQRQWLLMNRFKITKIHTTRYLIMDRKKLKTCIRNKRYTNRVFTSAESAQGFLFGKGKTKKYLFNTVINKDFDWEGCKKFPWLKRRRT